MTLYNLRSDGTITKWDADGNVQAQYSVSEDGCTCPAGHRHTCRHRQMLPDLLPIADTHWFLDWDNGRQIVDFNGIPKHQLDALIEDTAEYIDRNPSLAPASVDLPAEQDTTLHLKTTLPASSWRRI